jgi:GTP pyrophosphokinase
MLAIGSAVLAALLSGPTFPDALSVETLHRVAPAAELAGFGPGSALLQDEAFSIVDPDAYQAVMSARSADLPLEHRALASARASTESLLSMNGIHAKVEGRIKSAYSLAEKMKRKQLAMDEVLDRVALRVLVNSVDEAYAVRDLLHERLAVIADAQDDYIANPKGSGYRALHTAVVDRSTRWPVEVQIRTHAMHAEAESGPAAHWRYKLDGGEDGAVA